MADRGSQSARYEALRRDYGPFRPVVELFGARTLEVLSEPDRAESYIIEVGPTYRGLGLAGCTILAQGPSLTPDQLARLTTAIMTPEAHYNGRPIFKRWPSVPNFSFRIWRQDSAVDVLVDLHNPGWEFYCGSESYENWNWVGSELVQLAKELFPNLASPSSRAVWKKGAIEGLKKEYLT